MADNKKQQLARRNPKWVKESDKIRSVQISLDFPDATDIMLRTLAARQHKAPSSLVREILGMPSSPPKRARIGVSFNDDELAVLGQRFGVDPANKAEIRRRVTQEVTALLADDEENEIAETSTQNLKAASDAIFQRFEQAIHARKNNKREPK